MSAVDTTNAQSLACFACFGVTFASVAFASATIAGTAPDMSAVGDVAVQVTPTWALTFAWWFFFCHAADCRSVSVVQLIDVAD